MDLPRDAPSADPWARRQARFGAVRYDAAVGAGHFWSLAAVGALGALGVGCASERALPAASDAGVPVADAATSEDANADAPPESAAIPTAHSALPVVRYRGGPIVDAPVIVTVTFPADALRPRLEAFGDALTQSTWWTKVAAGYCITPPGIPCVGKGKGGGHVALAAPPDGAFSAAQVAQLVASHVADRSFPAPSAGTIYVLYFPSSVTLQDGLLRSCADFAGYHSFVNVPPPGADGGTPISVAYVAVPRCGPAEADATIAAAHQIIDTAIDPKGDAYATTDETWSAFFLSEAADLCATEAPMSEGGFALPRVWSNASASQGHNPCVPLAPGEIYFNASPPDKPVSLATGESATLDVVPFAESAGPDWTLSAVDYDELAGKPPTLALTLDRATVTDGTPAKLTVTLVNSPPERGFGLFALVSRRGKQVHYFPGRVLPK